MKSPETLGGEKKIDFTGGMGVGVYGSMRGQVCSEIGDRNRGSRDTAGIGNIEWWCGNLVQLKPPGMYEGDPNDNF